MSDTPTSKSVIVSLRPTQAPRRMSEAPDSDLFMSRVDALLRGGALQVSPLGAGIIVAIDMGIADSRSFSRLLGVEHALVLREIADLSGPGGAHPGDRASARRPSAPRLPCLIAARFCYGRAPRIALFRAPQEQQVRGTIHELILPHIDLFQLFQIRLDRP